MRKIPTLFRRDPDDRAHVLPEPDPSAAWVLAGEGTATRKWDGTAVRIDADGFPWKRYELRPWNTPPAGFEPAGEPDPVTGKTAGWFPVGDGPEDRWHREALWDAGDRIEPGTYELLGPKVQGNPEGFERHVLVRHGEDVLPDAPRDFDGLREYLLQRSIEGIVWHHEDGRMAKIKRRDFRP